MLYFVLEIEKGPIHPPLGPSILSASQEFESISQIASQMIGEIRSYESKKSFQKKINYVEYSANDESEEEQETVASAEWI